MDDYEFRKRCSESADEVWAEAIEKIKAGESNQYVGDRISEQADSAVPIYTRELYELVEYLDEQWEEAAPSAKTLDDALRFACYMKASEYIHHAFGELGGEEKLEELEELWGSIKSAMDECDHATYVQLLKEFKEDCELLGLDTSMPEAKPAPKPTGPK